MLDYDTLLEVGNGVFQAFVCLGSGTTSPDGSTSCTGVSW